MATECNMMFTSIPVWQPTDRGTKAKRMAFTLTVGIVVSQMLDLLSTAVCLRFGVPEANPVTAVVNHVYGPVGLVAMKLAVTALISWCVLRVRGRFMTAGALGSILLTTAVVCSNLAAMTTLS